MDRRAFLRRSGLGVGVGIAASQLTLVKKAQAADGNGPAVGEGRIEVKRTVCSHCSVGCAVDAVVENGVWVRQEPVFDSPINLGAHCAKGAAMREHGHGEFRLRYPMKLVDGKYQRISWDQALNEISAKLLNDLRKASGPDSVFWIGSSKHNNEQSYLMRKFVSLWGSNNCDHQARICHSTTVAGVANTWGYGAMTNSYNDMQNSKCCVVHRLERRRGAPGLHAAHAARQGERHQDDRGRPALHAHGGQGRPVRAHPLRLRHPVPVRRAAPHLQERLGRQEVHQRPRLRHGQGPRGRAGQVDAGQGVRRPAACPRPVFKVAETMAKNRPSTIVWCMGQTQHSIGNAMVRASCILQLALGNVGVSGGGANIFRGHDNVQGATDIGPNPDSLPGYYGIAEGSWRHFAKVWGVDYDWIKGRFANPGMMTKPGITVSRWIDGVLEKNELHRPGLPTCAASSTGATRPTRRPAASR
jgi:formate dehydrogenase major subunit